MPFVTADLHFGHTLAVHKFRQDFDTVEAMDEHLIERWNATVPPRQVVYCIGDFSFHKDVAKTQEIISRLNGQINWVRGNHDQDLHKALGFRPVDYAEVKHKKNLFVLCHYAMRTWRRSNKGSYMLYGHSHGDLDFVSGKFRPWGRSMDVGVDAAYRHSVGYRPLHLDEVVATLESQDYTNHHSDR